MTPLFKKLNFKDQQEIVAIHAPASFGDELAAIAAFTTVKEGWEHAEAITFAIGFVTTQAQIDQLMQELAPKLIGDATLWLCYPKGSSKKYKCDFNRDTGWATLGQYRLEPVRQVAIDEDWSALRFRRVDFIKNITRKESFALTAEAKQRTTQKGQ
jgi:hypothetical protein